jgi:Uncharacterized protein conserved in bacteria (DUF2252)
MRNHPAGGETAGERRAEHGTYEGRWTGYRQGPGAAFGAGTRGRTPNDRTGSPRSQATYLDHLMHGRDGSDPLFLQVNDAGASVPSRYCGASQYADQGQWVIAGQRLMQAASDIYARQLRDWKYSFDIGISVPHGPRLYGERCGWTLARAHARSGDRIAIAAYLAGSDVFDQAVTKFAAACADQAERDRQILTSGRITAERDI